MPLSKLFSLILNLLPVIRVALVDEVVVGVGGEGETIACLVVSDEHSQSTITDKFVVLVKPVAIDGEPEPGMPDVLVNWNHPLEPAADCVFFREDRAVNVEHLIWVEHGVFAMELLPASFGHLDRLLGIVFIILRHLIALQHELIELLDRRNDCMLARGCLNRCELPIERRVAFFILASDMESQVVSWSMLHCQPKNLGILALELDNGSVLVGFAIVADIHIGPNAFDILERDLLIHVVLIIVGPEPEFFLAHVDIEHRLCAVRKPCHEVAIILLPMVELLRVPLKPPEPEANSIGLDALAVQLHCNCRVHTIVSNSDNLAVTC